MKIQAVVFISILSVFALLLLCLHIKSRRPLRSAGINAVLGVAALIAVNLSTHFTGIHIPVNVYTLPGTVVFGLPACAAFVILQIIV